MASPVKDHAADPFSGFNFLVEIDKTSGIKGMFREVSGLKGDVEEFEVFEGGVNDRTHKFPGQVKWGPLTLKKGVATDNSLWEWWNAVVTNDKDKLRRNITITLKNRDNSTTVATWNVKDAYPRSWEGMSMNATSSDMAVESITISHSGVEEKKE